MHYIFSYISPLVDTPDPYVKLLIPTSPNGKRRTKVQRNSSNPTWDEVFYFYIDPEKMNLLRKLAWHVKKSKKKNLKNVWKYDSEVVVSNRQSKYETD